MDWKWGGGSGLHYSSVSWTFSLALFSTGDFSGQLKRPCIVGAMNTQNWFFPGNIKLASMFQLGSQSVTSVQQIYFELV